MDFEAIAERCPWRKMLELEHNGMVVLIPAVCAALPHTFKSSMFCDESNCAPLFWARGREGKDEKNG